MRAGRFVCAGGTTEKRSGTGHYLSPTLGGDMRRHATWLIAGICVSLAASLRAQATGMPSFNAPYRAFHRSEFGVVASFPHGNGAAFEGVYRYAVSNFDVAFRGGMYDPGGSFKTALLLGAEARDPAITHTIACPLDAPLALGLGGAL